MVEARQIPNDPEGAEAVAAWCDGRLSLDPPGVRIETQEGTMFGDPGDWIIRGVQGEHYPCKPDIFKETYEPVATDDRED